MRKANLISGIFLLGFSLLLLFWLIPWQVEEAFGGEVSPRLLPQICAVGIGLLSIILITTNLKAPSADADPGPFPISWPEFRALLVIGILLALGIFLFVKAGPIIASVVLVVGVMYAMGERNPLPFVLIPVVLLVSSWFLFYKVLGTAIQ